MERTRFQISPFAQPRGQVHLALEYLREYVLVLLIRVHEFDYTKRTAEDCVVLHIKM